VLILVPVQAWAEVNFILDLQPLSFLLSSDVDGFEVTRSSGSITYIEKIEGYGSFMPNLKAGISIGAGKVMHLDITGGLGYLWNSAFSVPVFSVDVAPRFKLGTIVTLAPHIGYIKFGDLEWIGENFSDSNDVKFSDGGAGLIYGVSITVGKKVSFVGSIDGISVEEYNVKTYNGWAANQKTLDISGVAVQLGVKFRF
jgi:hypothetical protein